MAYGVFYQFVKDGTVLTNTDYSFTTDDSTNTWENGSFIATCTYNSASEALRIYSSNSSRTTIQQLLKGTGDWAGTKKLTTPKVTIKSLGDAFTKVVERNTQTELTIDTSGNVTVLPLSWITAPTTTSQTIYFDVSTGGTVEYTYTENLTGCTSDYTDTTITAGAHTITFTANTDYVFTIPPTATGGTITSYEISDDKQTLIAIVNVTGDFAITLTAHGATYSYSETLTNCTSSFAGKTTIAAGTNTITFYANDGYEFTTANPVYITYGSNQTSIAIQGTEASIQWIASTDVSISLIATIKEVEKASSFVYLYTPTDNELQALAKVRFIDESGSVVDRGEYVTNLYYLPFNLPTALLGSKQNINLGNVDSEVQATVLTNYITDIAGGAISVPAIYNNVYDYKNTTATLFLPFANSIELPIDYVIGQTITINYKINLYDGTCNINILSTYIDANCATVTVNVANSLPIRFRENNIVSKLDIQLYNDIYTPYIIIERNVPYDVATQWGKPTIDSGIVSDFVGYIEAEFIDIASNATQDEKDEIATLFAQGVFIE